MKTVTFIITALLLAVSTSAFATGSIAVASDGQGGYAYGLNHDYPDQASASAAALAKCDENRAKYGVATACKVATWYTNACGAVATSPNHALGWSWRNTSSEASAAAVTNCIKYGGVNCQVQHVDCDGTAR
jgi:alpha-glucosidase (family GH31 glycosyl hydrolase)